MKSAATKFALAGIAIFIGLITLIVMLITVLLGGGFSEEETGTLTGELTGFRHFDTTHVPAWAVGHITAAAKTCPEVTAPLLAAQIEAESNWNANARSHVGAQGLAQFMPATWTEKGRDGDNDGVADPFNPADAIRSQAAYMCELFALVAKHSQRLTGAAFDLAVAAYNAGFGNVTRHGGVPPFVETVNYVAKIRELITTKYARPPPGASGPIGGGAISSVVIAVARDQIGVPYAWGGGNITGPSAPPAGGTDAGVVGFDCSSLVRFAYYQGSNAAITLPRTSREQYQATKSAAVTGDRLLPGDLLFWAHNPSDPTTIYHVAIYSGGGRMIEAPQSGQRVAETDERTRSSDYLGATRVAPAQL